MAAIAKKKALGQAGEFRSTANRQSEPYIVHHATSVADAVGTAYTEAPATVTTDDGKTLYKAGLSWEVIGLSPDEATGSYEVTVNYTPAEDRQQPIGSVRIHFSTAGGTQHVTQSKATTQVYSADGGDVPDFNGAIGVTADGVDGVDIGVPVFHFTVTIVYAADDLPDLGDVYAAGWHTNDASVTFTDSVTGASITLLEGELLFEGADGGEARSDGGVEIVYTFSGSPNVDNLTIGTMTGIVKAGWEYVWVRYVEATSGTGASKTTIKRPKFAIVERVYDPADIEASLNL